MGLYLNPNNDDFKTLLNSAIYVDKTGMSEQLNLIVGVYEQNTANLSDNDENALSFAN